MDCCYCCRHDVFVTPLGFLDSSLLSSLHCMHLSFSDKRIIRQIFAWKHFRREEHEFFTKPSGGHSILLLYSGETVRIIVTQK